MSGSDGPSSTGGQPGGQILDDCGSLQIDDWIQSPDDQYPFAVGQIFVLELDPDTPPTIALSDGHGVEVGAVQPRPALIRCIQRGAPFRATVANVSGSTIKVHIEAIR